MSNDFPVNSPTSKDPPTVKGPMLQVEDSENSP